MKVDKQKELVTVIGTMDPKALAETLKDKLKKNTLVVLVTILVLAVAIGIMDFAFSRGIMLLRDLFQ